jgi:hypothetical protein
MFSHFPKFTKIQVSVLSFIGLFFVSSVTMAITAPAAGSFAYDLYDIGVNQILNGAPGFVGGVLGLAYAGAQLARNWMVAVLSALGSTAVLQADNITATLGATIGTLI